MDELNGMYELNSFTNIPSCNILTNNNPFCILNSKDSSSSNHSSSNNNSNNSNKSNSNS
jgi:hypothetical protein